MYKELEKFTVNGNFTFTQEDNLEAICNASDNASGVFVVYAIEAGAKELIMVGSTGTVQNDGTLKSKNGGLYDKIVNGHQFAKTGRKYSWPAQMKKENMTVRNSYQESNILKMHFASLRLCAKLGSQRRRDAKSIKDKGCEKYSTTNLFCERVLVTDSHKI